MLVSRHKVPISRLEGVKPYRAGPPAYRQGAGRGAPLRISLDGAVMGVTIADAAVDDKALYLELHLGPLVFVEVVELSTVEGD